jgi:hypothetical protein
MGAGAVVVEAADRVADERVAVLRRGAAVSAVGVPTELDSAEVTDASGDDAAAGAVAPREPRADGARPRAGLAFTGTTVGAAAS